MGRLRDLGDMINRVRSLPTWLWTIIFVVAIAVYIALTAYNPQTGKGIFLIGAPISAGRTVLKLTFDCPYSKLRSD